MRPLLRVTGGGSAGSWACNSSRDETAVEVLRRLRRDSSATWSVRAGSDLAGALGLLAALCRRVETTEPAPSVIELHLDSDTPASRAVYACLRVFADASASQDQRALQ